MYSINREVAIIKPKPPYINWINSLPGTKAPIGVEDLKKDCTAILLPPSEDDEEALQFIRSIYTKIFRVELAGWSTDEKTWPKKRNYSLFLKWFDVEIHTEVLDFLESDIEKDEY